jgi:hypothetical protein
VQLEDGAVVYAQYYGLLEMNDAVSGALQNGSATTFEQYFRTTPRFETSDQKWAWLQQSVFIGQGRILEGPASSTTYSESNRNPWTTSGERG